MKKIVAVILLCLSITKIYSQDEEFCFRRLSVEDGLNSGMVRAVIQDHLGFIWFGTDDGINRFDGEKLKNYKFTGHTGNESVSSLFEFDDKIYAGTERGLFFLNYQIEKFERFEKKTASGVSIKVNVNHIIADKDSNLWLSTVGQGIFKYNPGNGSFEQYKIAEPDGGLAASVLIDSENQVWACSIWEDGQLFKLNKAENKFEVFKPIYADKSDNCNALIMTEDSEHNLWLGSWENGLQKINRYTKKAEVFLNPGSTKGTFHIHSLIEYQPGKLLLGSDEGLLLFDTHTHEYKCFTEDETNPHSLSDRFVYPIMLDREGGLWIGTYYGGVNYKSPGSGQFEYYTSSKYCNSLSGRVISRFCEDEDGNIYIASDDGGLNFYSKQTELFSQLLDKQYNVHALCKDGNNLWVGTYTSGIICYNTINHSIKKLYPSNNSNRDYSSCYCIFKDSKNNLWATTMSGVLKYNPKSQDFDLIKNFESLTMDIDEDSKGNLWFSTQGAGLFKYNPEFDVWRKYVTDTTSSSLPSNYINCSYVYENKQLFVATLNGLCRYNYETDNFQKININSASSVICAIVSDQNYLWLSTAKGLIRYSLTQETPVKNFSKSDGLRCEQFIPNSALKTSDGKIYFGSVNGVTAFYPYKIKTNKVLPVVILTGIKINNKPIVGRDDMLPRCETAFFDYNENDITVSFSAMSYCAPEKNRYVYMLEGFDKEWIYVDGQTEAVFTNIPPGKYVFKVRACNNDGLWNENFTSINIEVKPPFYWNTASKIFYLLLIAALLFLIVKYLLSRQTILHTQEIEGINIKKEKEVHQAKIEFFTMIAHEIRTPVSLIIGPLEKIMKNNTEIPFSIKDDLHVINRNSQRLLNLINQLLDFKKIEQQGLKFTFRRRNIYQIVEAVIERFNFFAIQFGDKFKVIYPSRNFTAVVDAESITKLISNLLTNAGKYTKDEITVACLENVNRGTFTISVSDNGVGISDEDKKKIFKPFFQAMENKPGTGIGLNIVKHIVDAHKGTIDVISRLGEGSQFIVTLPIENEQEATVSEEISETRPDDILSGTRQVSWSNNNPTMLIVDDNPDMLKFLSDNFINNYSVIIAEDGKQALDKLKENEINLIISDWMMPVMDGAELCKRVRADFAISHIPFILLTAKTDLNSKISGINCGADAYIEKPFSIDYLEACIKNLLELRDLLKSKFSKLPQVPITDLAVNSSDNEFLKRINQIIEQNFADSEFSIDQLAEQLCVSRSGLFSKIKNMTDVTPNDIIRIVRLKKAAELLLENKYQIKEICYMVGFSSPSYFAKCFQKQFGIRPKEFIDNNGKNFVNQP